MITPRENLLRVFRREMPEWIPITGHVDPYSQPNRQGMDPALAEALGEMRWCDEGTVNFSRYLGLDIMDYLNPPVRITRKNTFAETTQAGADTTVTWHTPRGELREVTRRCRDDGTSYRVEHLVKGPRDLPVLAAMFEDEQIEFDSDGVALVKQRRELIRDDGMLMLFMPGTPLGMMYRVYSGVETLAYLCADAPAALCDLFAVMEKNYQQQFRLASQTDADALVTMDDTSTTVISPRMFAEFNLGYTDRMAAVAHDAGKLYFHHSCGLIRDLLPLYRQTQMDAVHAFTIPPIGNVTVAEGRRLLGDGDSTVGRITIIAGLMQLSGPIGDWPAVQRSIREMFQAGQYGLFIASLFGEPERTMEQTVRLLDECRQYQRLGWGDGVVG
ncbi:MAG TPA: uroporphyrinogen decarboxylase family protein [Planctomycetota bacterium]|nr:uroporphyrinogen decarboxylase family protein [Planctomycetota bacterium]